MTHSNSIDQFNLEIAPGLRDFMFNNLTDLNETIDWVCDVFDLSATDWLIDRISDEYEEFHGV